MAHHIVSSVFIISMIRFNVTNLTGSTSSTLALVVFLLLSESLKTILEVNKYKIDFAIFSYLQVPQTNIYKYLIEMIQNIIPRFSYRRVDNQRRLYHI